MVFRILRVSVAATALTDDRRRFMSMGLLGFAAGLPLALTTFTLSQWLAESGTSLTAIGLTSTIGLAYTLKILWSPILDHVPPPAGLARFGRRRGWLLVIQPLLACAALALALSDPVAELGLTMAAAASVAFLSASQDVVVDAWRVESFVERTQGKALACYIWGYRIALLVAGQGALKLVRPLGWHGALGTVVALLCCGPLVTMAAREPVVAKMAVAARGVQGRLREVVIEPFREFWRRPGAGRVLAFVLLFKLGEALAHGMALPFYHALGYDRDQIVDVTAVPGLIASLSGAVAGGWLIARVGTGRALISTGFLQMASMALYFALAVSGPDTVILGTKITVENFAEAMADAAFITFLSSLCSTAFTATQYALLSSLSAVGLRTVAGLSGVLAGALGWVPYYAMTIFAAVPAMLIMLFILRRYPDGVAQPT